jgi:hypothetical protein
MVLLENVQIPAGSIQGLIDIPLNNFRWEPNVSIHVPLFVFMGPLHLWMSIPSVNMYKQQSSVRIGTSLEKSSRLVAIFAFPAFLLCKVVQVFF